MPHSESERTAARRARSKFTAAVVIVSAALVGAAFLVVILPVNSELGATDVNSGWPTTADSAVPTTEDRGRPGRPERRDPRAVAGEADGALPAGVTVFDDEFPAVANLDPELLAALRQAAEDAEDDGVEFVVNSGWRSAAYQDQLLREAVAEYGSEEEAARWVATPETSPHVRGEAIDLGPVDAVPWLSEHGAAHGLCQIYDNEPWHYELRPEAADDGCPRRYADPTQDPRMQR